jgi:hypothetical protein
MRAAIAKFSKVTVHRLHGLCSDPKRDVSSFDHQTETLSRPYYFHPTGILGISNVIKRLKREFDVTSILCVSYESADICLHIPYKFPRRDTLFTGKRLLCLLCAKGTKLIMISVCPHVCVINSFG